MQNEYHADDKLTENETVLILMEYLKSKEWTIQSYCLGQEKGNDIVATKNKDTLIIEAKGAKADDKSPTKIREQFSSGQIKKHFGAALVKILEQKTLNPSYFFAIARPNDPLLKKHTGKLIPFLKILNIKHYWVSANGNVTEE